MIPVTRIRSTDTKRLVFDFSEDMYADEHILSVNVAISVWVGTDVGVQALLKGQPQHYRYFVEQDIGSGFQPGVIYLIVATISTSQGQTLSRPKIVRCVELSLFEPPPPVPPPLQRPNTITTLFLL